MFAGLVGTVVASGLLLRGAWDVWAQSLILFGLLFFCAVWLCLHFSAGLLPCPDTRLLAWAAALAVMSAWSAWMSRVPAYAWPAWAATAAGLALFPLIAVLDSEGRARAERFLRAAGWVLVLLAFYQRLRGEARPPAALLNQNVFAGAILLLLPIASRAGDWALAGGLLICLWWTRSVGAWLGLSAALILRRRAAGAVAFRFGAVAGFVGLVVAYAKLQSPEILHRVEWWKAAWRMAADAPWLGLGPGAYAYALPAYAPGRPELSSLFAHQHILELAAERGWPYALLWLAGLAALLRPASAARRFGPVAALIHGLVDYALSVPGVFWLFCASTALAAPESGRFVNVPLRWRAALCAAVLAAAGVAGVRVRRGWSADRLRAQAVESIRSGRLAEAADKLAAADRSSPHPETARLRAEIALARGGGEAEAAAHLERAIALDPYRASNRVLLEALRKTHGR
ncbi:MAG: O-antigen ligase family protein [Elusimicrobia bacterium]|nr:O-antigen ligase family protein [Elusimicrobiota bacterium]